jgi:PEP-CTERM motif
MAPDAITWVANWYGNVNYLASGRSVPRFAMKFLLHLAASGAALSAAATAQVINIDFDESAVSSIYQGLAAAPDPAGGSAQWNRVTGSGTTTVTASSLTDSDGDTTGVGIELEINGSYLELAGQQEMGGVPRTYEDMMSDYVYLSSPTNTQVVTKSGTIFGLEPARLYDVYLYAQGDDFTEDFSPGQNALFTINGISKQTSWDGVVGGNGLLVEGIEYVRFSVLADPSGEIAFSYANVVSGSGGNVVTDLDGVNSRFAGINGIQVVDVAAVVPEPSAALLGGIGLLGLLRRRR